MKAQDDPQEKTSETKAGKKKVRKVLPRVKELKSTQSLNEQKGGAAAIHAYTVPPCC